MKILSTLLGITLLAGTAIAQDLSNEACEQLITQAEEKNDPVLYDDCGFGNEARAWAQWAPFVTAHGLRRATFELCRRYPGSAYGALYCKKAEDMNFGPALVRRGKERLRADNVKEALHYFDLAVKSGDLSEEETIKVMEILGMIHLDKTSSEYAPDSGIALLTKAANGRSAVANNTLAYLSFSGEHRIQKDYRKTLFFLWKSILLGCPAAEENLGAYHLAKQGKISEEDARYYMSLQAYTCEPFDKSITDNIPVGCDCKDILKQEKFFRSQPYFYLGQQQDGTVILKNHAGETFSYSKGEILPDDSIIQEVSPSLVTLMKNGKKSFANLYHQGRCVDHCLEPIRNPNKRTPVRIRPYHLTFTEQECANIEYYAPRLLDTALPYVGKEECHKPEMDETTQLLLNSK